MERPLCVLVQLTAVWSGGGACSRSCYVAFRSCCMAAPGCVALCCLMQKLLCATPRLYGLGMLVAGTTVCPGEVLVDAVCVWFGVAYIAEFVTASVEGRLLIGHIDMSEVLSIFVFIQLSKLFRGH